MCLCMCAEVELVWDLCAYTQKFRCYTVLYCYDLGLNAFVVSVIADRYLKMKMLF